MKATRIRQLMIALPVALLLAGPLAVGQQGKRLKVIDFDDEVVEGMNKRPLDSVSEINDREHAHRKPHLYRKRAGFRSETEQTLHDLRYN